MITDIAKFNYLRNSLELSKELEESMLIEEEQEFIEAYKTYLEFVYIKTDILPQFKEDAILDCLVDMTDAYCDYMYVYYGTLLKYLGTGEVYDRTQKQTLMNTILIETLVRHGIKVYEQGKVPITDKAMSIVTEANDNKPIKKTKGKVSKGKAWRDPKEGIKELLLDRGFQGDPEAVLEGIRKKIEEATKEPEVIDIKDIPVGDETDEQ